MPVIADSQLCRTGAPANTLAQPLAQCFTPFTSRGPPRRRQQRCCVALAKEPHCTADWPRRGLLQLPALALLCKTLGVQAAEETGTGVTTSYQDSEDKFSIKVPDGWMFGTGGAVGGKGFTGASGIRRALAWFPETGGADTNVTILVTNVGADYTKLGSFGTAQDFGNNLVVSMDRTYLLRRNRNAGPVQMAKLLDAKEQDRKYFLEYTVQKPEEDEPRHFLSAVSLGFNGRYNKLFTVTAQCRESELSRYRSTLQATINSFTPPAPVF